MIRKSNVVFTVYYNPSDYPNKYVVRLWVNNIPERKPKIVCADIESAKSVIPKEYQYLSPYKNDDPVIIETYVHRSVFKTLSKLQSEQK